MEEHNIQNVSADSYEALCYSSQCYSCNLLNYIEQIVMFANGWRHVPGSVSIILDSGDSAIDLDVFAFLLSFFISRLKDRSRLFAALVVASGSKSAINESTMSFCDDNQTENPI